MTFFTSDQHFGHAAIIKYQRHQFATVTEMDDALVANWNARVGKRDLVYHLGDLAQTRRDLLAVRPRLNGRIVLIRGNHDDVKLTSDLKFTSLFDSIHDLLDVNIPIGPHPELDVPARVQHIVLCHYAMRAWKNRHYGSWHLYGHSHGNLPDSDGLAFDVGVDCPYANLAPLSLHDVVRRMTFRTPTATLDAGDHHKPSSSQPA